MPEIMNVAANVASLIISGEIPMRQAPSHAAQTSEHWCLEAIKLRAYVV